jgi:hypothetical protein
MRLHCHARVNKYCLLRIWRTPPPMSDFITQVGQLAALSYLKFNFNLHACVGRARYSVEVV